MGMANNLEMVAKYETNCVFLELLFIYLPDHILLLMVEAAFLAYIRKLSSRLMLYLIEHIFLAELM